jgi:hypothetical protein
MKEVNFTKSISINLAEETFEKIKEITDLQQVSISEWFRVAAELVLNTNHEEVTSNNLIACKGRFHSTAIEFFRNLFGRFLSAEYGQVELRLIRDGEVRCTLHSRYETLVDEAYEACNFGWNAYFGVNPRVGGEGRKENIHYLKSFYAEVNYGIDDHKKKTRYATYEEAHYAIREYDLQPTVMTHSDGAFHCYWVLENAVAVEIYGIETLERINKGLSKDLKAKVGTHDLGMVLDIPKIFNLKLPDNRREVNIELLGGLKYRFDDISEKFLKPEDNYQYQCNRVLNTIRSIFSHEEQEEVITLEGFYYVYQYDYYYEKNIFSKSEITDVIISLGYKVNNSCKHNNKLCIFNEFIW